MALELKNVSQRVGADTYIHETNLVLEQGSFNVLLGTTLAGKTTLMQLIAGIQKPTTGEIWFKGQNITRLPVQKRNVSMVYQQFINYPNFNVFENIASPLRVTGMAESEVKSACGKASEILRLTPMLDRKPAELSGGQQQRTAIARAVVKDSDIILLDEPLANLDYKLREELRDELPKLFHGRDAIVVYATTEPTEALLFGGNTATLHEGRITQFGPTAEIYRKPNSLVSAQVFSDPPINIAKISKRGNEIMHLCRKNWPVGRAENQFLMAITPLGSGPTTLPPSAIGKPVAPFRAACWSPSFPDPKVLFTVISGARPGFLNPTAFIPSMWAQPPSFLSTLTKAFSSVPTTSS